jgi:hypothetical protein
MAFKSEIYQQFIEHEFTIIDKDRNEVPFELNKAQAHFIQNLGPLNNVLKNRKQGISSVSLGIAVTKFLMGKNERCVSVSFIDSSAHQQLQRAKHFLESYQRLNGVRMPLKYDNKSEWVYAPTDAQGNVLYTNTLRVGSAKSKSFGRGDDITFLHITEAAFAGDLEGLKSGIGEAVTNDSITILETTANGYDQFKTHWDMTEAGQTTYQNFFYDPFWTYSKEFVEEKRNNLGRLGAQEYPYTAKEAFLTSGFPYFENQPMMEYEKQTLGNVPSKTILNRDMFRQWRPITKGEFFMVFLDTAGEGSDFNSAPFLSRDYLDVPITLRYEGSVIDVTPQLKIALEWVYDQTGVKPVVSYETNNGGGYELERLERLNTNQKYIVYKQYQLDPTTRKLIKTDKLGWNTNSATRPVMLAGVEELVNNQLVKIYDPATIAQMFSFVKHKTSSGWRAEAETGAHDDDIMSLAGVWQMYQTEKPQAQLRQHTTRKKAPRAKFHV